jgi:hypothetical protein
MIANEPDGSDQRPIGTPGEVRLADASDHVKVCLRCGQSYDTRILHQVIYHDQPGHKPIELNS